MSRVQIFEPIYATGQELVEPAFTALRTKNDRAPWREFAIFVDIYRAGLHRGPGLTGVFSPKFQLKTGISGKQFVDFIEENPGGDVYIANPGPASAFINFNIWENGEMFHPGIVGASQALLDAAGIGWDLSDQPRHGIDVLLYCNFWVGTEAFWDDYVGRVLLPIAKFLEREPEHPASRGIFQDTKHTSAAPYLPFMIERMFTTYLKLHPSWSTVAWHRDPLESCITPLEREIVSYMAPILSEAETKEFSPELRRMMRFLTQADHTYKGAYFQTVPHPHVASPTRPATANGPSY